MIPHDIDVRLLYATAFGPALDDDARLWLSSLETELGSEDSARLREDLALFRDLARDDAAELRFHADEVLERWLPRLLGRLHEGIRAFVGRFRPPVEMFEDFAFVAMVLGGRRVVRERKDERSWGSAYSVFKAYCTCRPVEMWHAFTARRREEIAADGRAGPERRALADVELLDELQRALDCDSDFAASKGLIAAWRNAYERPVLRVIELLWRFGQECRGPGGAGKTPPSSSGGASGELFRQTVGFLSDLALPFPFEPRLHEIRNAIHGRQTTIRRDGSVEFRRSNGTVVADLTCDELLDSARHDIEFAVVADQPLFYALISTLDARGVFDSSWERLSVVLGAARRSAV